MSATQLLARLHGVKRCSSGWGARCPAHDDHKASLSVTEGSDGRILLNCFAGCPVESIVGALGLTLADLFPSRTGKPVSSNPRIVATYNYTDEVGMVLFQCVRYEPKDFRQRRPDPSRPGQWLWNLNGVPRVLYRLPELKTALAERRTIFVAEGEKDCDALVKAGFVGTCNPLGAKKDGGSWLPEHTDTLRGAARVVVIADKDETGRAHALIVASSVRTVVPSVKLVELPDRDGRKVKDSHDFFAAGGTADELKAIVRDAPEFVSSAASPAPQRTKADTVASEYLSADSPPLDALPYTPPPLHLLPSELQDYVLAASESLAVDPSYILLPVLSAMGTAIGDSRVIQLKPGFVQPPVIWTSIIGRSGAKKSPALDEGTFPIRERERAFICENRSAAQEHEKLVAEWETASRKERGIKPTPPPRLTALLDDLTLAGLALALVENPRGLLVKKDELSHWFESFDQFTKAHGADASRWLSLHTGVLFAYDRKTERERHRLFNPRVCIAGGIQPKTLRRCLTEEFFDRGLPARFLFACPPGQQDRWTEKTVPSSK